MRHANNNPRSVPKLPWKVCQDIWLVECRRDDDRCPIDSPTFYCQQMGGLLNTYQKIEALALLSDQER